MSIRMEKVARGLQRRIAEYVERESGPQSLITITHVDISPDLKYAEVYASVLPEQEEDSSLAWLNRRCADIQRAVAKAEHLKYTPLINFVLDRGEKNRQQIEALSSEIDDSLSE